jgi:hypothetical protein
VFGKVHDGGHEGPLQGRWVVESLLLNHECPLLLDCVVHLLHYVALHACQHVGSQCVLVIFVELSLVYVS